MVQNKIRIGVTIRIAGPVVKEKLAEAAALDALEKLLGDDLVGVHVDAVERRDESGMKAKRLHQRYLHSRMSVKRPVMAAAAAMAGLIKCVRPPRP